MNERFHPVALDEFEAGGRYYSEINSELGARFYCEIERLIHEACADPMRFRKFDPPVRRHFSRNFPYAVIYLEKPDHIWIVAVMHMKREPGFWKHRLSD